MLDNRRGSEDPTGLPGFTGEMQSAAVSAEKERGTGRGPPETLRVSVVIVNEYESIKCGDL